MRGRGSVLEDITAEDIIATIQVNSEWLEVGPHTVPVTLTTSDPERLTIVGEYSVAGQCDAMSILVTGLVLDLTAPEEEAVRRAAAAVRRTRGAGQRVQGAR